MRGGEKAAKCSARCALRQIFLRCTCRRPRRYRAALGETLGIQWCRAGSSSQYRASHRRRARRSATRPGDQHEPRRESVVVTAGRGLVLLPRRCATRGSFDGYFGVDRVGNSSMVCGRCWRAARWDRATEAVCTAISLSSVCARRIALYYNRQSTLVYPPVDTDFYSADNRSAGTASPTHPPKFLVVSALVPYKRVDLAMMAARQAGVGLTVVGNGPERSNLERLAGDGIELLGWRTDDEIRDLYRSSTATILPGEEDFGIVPVEAQACGRPVVALGRGGALDTVIDGETAGCSRIPRRLAGAALTRAARIDWDAAESAGSEGFSPAASSRRSARREGHASARSDSDGKRHQPPARRFHVVTDRYSHDAFFPRHLLRFENG